MEWNAATQTLSTFDSSSGPGGVAVGMVVDASGNVYAVDSSNGQITETPRAYVSGGPVSEGAAAGSDALAVGTARRRVADGYSCPPQQRELADPGRRLGRRARFLV